MKIGFFVAIPALLLLLAADNSPAKNQEVSTKAEIYLARDKESCSVILHPAGCALSERTARKLSDYIKEQTDAAVEVCDENAFKMPDSETVVIIIDGTADHRLLKKFGQQAVISSDRDDAYRLKVLIRKDLSPLVMLAGKGPEGAKYAAYRLMRELEVRPAAALIRPLDVKAEPLIKNRVVGLFNIWWMPTSVECRHNLEAWPIEKIDQSIDMYDFYGFNAIETHDRFSDNYLKTLFEITRNQWRDKVLGICDRAHANGQKVFLRVWGHTVQNTPDVKKPLGPTESIERGLYTLCVNDPAERTRWENEIRDYYANNYAGRIDHLIGHWADPGVCRKNGCTYETAIGLHMELHKAFKALDPEFESTFSLHWMDQMKGRGLGWLGYEDYKTIVNDQDLPKEIYIAHDTTTSSSHGYKPEIVNAIVAAGHKPAVWTWYRADMEWKPSLHIHLHERIGDYFRNQIPADSARLLEWHTLERNVHGAANTANYYVAAKVMWDPTVDVDDTLREFAAFAFGPENADKITAAYLAIETMRCRYCYVPKGTATVTDNPQRDMNLADQVLAQLMTVKINPDFRPRIPLDVPAGQMLADLVESLSILREVSSYRVNELPAADKAIKAGDEKAAGKLLDELEAKCQQWQYTLAARHEWTVLKQQISAKRKLIKNP